MKTRHWIFQSRIATFALISYIAALLADIAADLIYGLDSFQVNAVVFYVSLAFIGVVLISAVFYIIMLTKSEKKVFLYILFSLPYLAFSVFRLLDIFSDLNNHLLEFILFIAGSLLVVISIIAISKFFRKKLKVPQPVDEAVLPEEEE